MPTLNDYIGSARRLLRDASGTLYPTPDLIAYTNEARHKRDLDTRLVRKVVGFTLTTLQSDYTLATISAGTTVRGEPFTNAREVVSLQVMPIGGQPGGVGLRYPLGRQPYSKVAYLVSRSWPSYPVCFAKLGLNTIVLAPPPAQDYPSEWDVIGCFPDLLNPADVEPMPDPYNDALPYLIAYVAKYNAQRFDEGKEFKAAYVERMADIGIQISQVAIPNPGFDLPRGVR